MLVWVSLKRLSARVYADDIETGIGVTLARATLTAEQIQDYGGQREVTRAAVLPPCAGLDGKGAVPRVIRRRKARLALKSRLRVA